MNDYRLLITTVSAQCAQVVTDIVPFDVMREALSVANEINKVPIHQTPAGEFSRTATPLF